MIWTILVVCTGLAWGADQSSTQTLAERILHSKIGERISQADTPQKRLADIEQWIQESPESAAQVAIGLAQDETRGDHAFEEAVLRNSNLKFATDTDHIDRSIYGRLKKSSAQSKLMNADEQMLDEEKSEIIKTMFEGRGNMMNMVVTPKNAGTSAPGISADYYDRLGHLNLHGYSPQLLAIQSALNQRRVPGAPRLTETGKLDYATLSYPAYAMRYDLDNLEANLRLQQNLELARLAGWAGRYTASQLLSPEIEALLKKKSEGAELNARFASRWKVLRRAIRAAREFEAAAEPAKNPARLTQTLLITLGAKQKEAARWITAASLEGEVQDLENVEGFLSPELMTAIDGCPLPEPMRAAYKRRGEGYRRTLTEMKGRAQDALRRLESDGWEKESASIGTILAQNAALRRNLSRNIQDFTQTPARLWALDERRPRWRAILEDAVKDYLPSTSWGQRLNRRQAQRELLKDVFTKIATGDLDAAHAILTSF